MTQSTRHALLQILIGNIIYFGLIIPVWFIEPITPSVSPAVYSNAAELYMYVVMTILMLSWIAVCYKFADKIATRINLLIIKKK